jgi:hypothetical protein
MASRAARATHAVVIGWSMYWSATHVLSRSLFFTMVVLLPPDLIEVERDGDAEQCSTDDEDGGVGVGDSPDLVLEDRGTNEEGEHVADGAEPEPKAALTVTWRLGSVLLVVCTRRHPASPSVS